MTISEILALKPGPELDRLVHKTVFPDSGKTKIPHYSTTNRWTEVFEQIPMICGQYRKEHEHYTPERPYFAHDTRLQPVNARTIAVAVCKAALIRAVEYGMTSHENP